MDAIIYSWVRTIAESELRAFDLDLRQIDVRTIKAGRAKLRHALLDQGIDFTQCHVERSNHSWFLTLRAYDINIKLVR